jgi:hemerythrin superfamily protein
MPTQAKTATRASSKTPAKTPVRRTKAEPNAIAILEADHKKVKKLFKDFEKLAKQGDEAGKVKIATQICQELTVHAQVEEEIFYPAAYAAFDEPDLVDEAEVEHASCKELIAQIESMVGSDALYDAKVKVLGEYINHHVEEEEGEMFPKARKAKMDLEGLGESITFRTEELMADLQMH